MAAGEQPITTLADAFKTLIDARGQYIKNLAEAYKFIQEGEKARAEAYKIMQQAYQVQLENKNLELILKFKERVLRETLRHINQSRTNMKADETLYRNARAQAGRLGLFNQLAGIQTSQQANQLWSAVTFVMIQPLGVYQGEFSASLPPEARTPQNFRFPGRGNRRESLPSHVQTLADLIQWLKGRTFPNEAHTVGNVTRVSRVVISGVPHGGSPAHRQLEQGMAKLATNADAAVTLLRQQVNAGLSEMLGKIPKEAYDMLQKEFGNGSADAA